MALPARMTGATVRAAQRILVASKNPVKVNAVRRGLQLCFPHAAIVVEGVDAASGVPDQPYGDDETLNGALNRVADLRSRAPPQPAGQILVAIEGGVGEAKGQPTGTLECFAWVVVQGASGVTSTSRTASFVLPDKLSALIKKGVELGAADDAVFGKVNSKQGQGTVGQLTNGLIDRTLFYEHAVVLALAPFMHPDVYGQEYWTELVAGRGGASGTPPQQSMAC